MTGLLAAAHPEAVAEAIELLLRDPGAADRMGYEAAQRAERDASWSTVADKASAAHRGALAGAHRQG